MKISNEEYQKYTEMLNGIKNYINNKNATKESQVVAPANAPAEMNLASQPEMVSDHLGTEAELVQTEIVNQTSQESTNDVQSQQTPTETLMDSPKEIVETQSYEQIPQSEYISVSSGAESVVSQSENEKTETLGDKTGTFPQTDMSIENNNSSNNPEVYVANANNGVTPKGQENSPIISNDPVLIPVGTTEEIATSDTMVVGPESFTR